MGTGRILNPLSHDGNSLRCIYKNSNPRDVQTPPLSTYHEQLAHSWVCCLCTQVSMKWVFAGSSTMGFIMTLVKNHQVLDFLSSDFELWLWSYLGIIIMFVDYLRLDLSRYRARASQSVLSCLFYGNPAPQYFHGLREEKLISHPRYTSTSGQQGALFHPFSF